MTNLAERHRNFRELHQSGCFVIPNPWDIGSARMMAASGAVALATSSAAFAFTLGRPDMGHVSREEALKELQQEIYPEELQAEDLAFVLKKLKLSQLEFDELMRTPPRRHLDFDNYRMFFRRYSYLAALRPVWETYRGWRLRTTG